MYNFFGFHILSFFLSFFIAILSYSFILPLGLSQLQTQQLMTSQSMEFFRQVSCTVAVCDVISNSFKMLNCMRIGCVLYCMDVV